MRLLQKTEDKPYISIIIPVYNVAPYLEKCVNSVIHQTYRNFEIILVDDGSTDASGEICDRFVAFHPRIAVIHKENGGLVSARKAGLKKASGEFIGYVDSDDWIEEDCYEKMAWMQKESGADIVAGSHYREVGMQAYVIPNHIPEGIYSRKSILPGLIYSGEFFEFGLHPSLCTKLIRKTILDKTQMCVNEDIISGEDAAVTYASILEADKILVTDICKYHYVQRQGSITKTPGADDLRRLGLMFENLEHVFRQKGVWNALCYQLNQWKKFLFLERQIQMFDEKRTDGLILSPYGAVPAHSRVVLYGGSPLGQTIYRYLSGNHLTENVLWIDREYENFRCQGLPIHPPEEIKKLNGEFDYVLLASVTGRIVDSMTECLLELEVPEQKIRWLTESFIRDEAGI